MSPSLIAILTLLVIAILLGIALILALRRSSAASIGRNRRAQRGDLARFAEPAGPAEVKHDEPSRARLQELLELQPASHTLANRERERGLVRQPPVLRKV